MHWKYTSREYWIYKEKYTTYRTLSWLSQTGFRDHFVYVLSQWKMMLQCNIISHWLGAFTKWSLFFPCSAQIWQRSGMWVGMDSELCGISLSNLWHFSLYVIVRRLFSCCGSHGPWFQHVPQPGGWGVRLWRYWRHEAWRVSVSEMYL